MPRSQPSGRGILHTAVVALDASHPPTRCGLSTATATGSFAVTIEEKYHNSIGRKNWEVPHGHAKSSRTLNR